MNGVAVALGVFANLLISGFVAYIKWLIRHPILGAILIGACAIFFWMNWDVSTWPMSKYANASVEQVTRLAKPDSCSGDDSTLVCTYDINTKITFINGRAKAFDFGDWNNDKSYTLTRSFEKSILNSIGENFVEPDVANADEIVWHNIDGLKEVKVTSDDDMNVAAMTVTVS